MKNGDMPAMPIEINGFGQYAPEVYGGLTKREMFAMAAMQGLLSRESGRPTDIAGYSVSYANQLLKALEE